MSSYKFARYAVGDTALNLGLAVLLFTIIRFSFPFIGPIPPTPFVTFTEFCIIVSMIFFVKEQSDDLIDRLTKKPKDEGGGDPDPNNPPE